MPNFISEDDIEQETLVKLKQQGFKIPKNLSSNIILKKSKPKKHNWQIHSKLIPSVIYHWCTGGAEMES